MSTFTDSVQQFSELLQNNSEILIILGADPSYDQVASALALADSLQDADKNVMVASPESLPDLFSSLRNTDWIEHKLGNQNLSVKFPYSPESVDKVSYHISDDEQRFYLLIQPQKGAKPLDSKQVTFDYTGASADLVILIGVHQLDSLDHLYEGYHELYEQTSIVSIHTFETAIGNIKIDTSSFPAYSQAMFTLLGRAQLSLSPDSATNLLAGIELVTNGMSSALTTADTFQTVAELLRLGARRIRPQEEVLKEQTTDEAATKKQNDGDVFSAANGVIQSNDVNGTAESLGFAEQLKQSSEKKLTPGSNNSKKNKKSKKKKKSPEPGGLNYQPGAEGGMSRG